MYYFATRELLAPSEGAFGAPVFMTLSCGGDIGSEEWIRVHATGIGTGNNFGATHSDIRPARTADGGVVRNQTALVKLSEIVVHQQHAVLG